MPDTKTIGILGGLSAESTVSYYQRITREAIARFGKPAYPEIVIYSVNFHTYAEWQFHGQWDKCAEHMLHCFEALEKAGADFALIASNTMHCVLPAIEARLPLPVLNIVDAVGAAVERAGLNRVALFGTDFTMTRDFYPAGLARRGIECIVPPQTDRATIHRIIYDELVNGVIRDESRDAYIKVTGCMKQQAAQGVIMGCTEIPLLLRPQDVDVPLFDSAIIHADAALDLATSAN